MKKIKSGEYLIIRRMDIIVQQYFWKKIQSGCCSRSDLNSLSSHPYLSLSMVEKNPDMPWNWRLLSRQERFHPLLEKFPERGWKRSKKKHTNIVASAQNYWRTRSMVMPISDILSNPSFPWVWPVVSHHPQLTMDHVINYPGFRWDLNHIMTSMRFDSHHLSQKIMDFRLLSRNPYNNISIIRRNLYKPWDWKALARHPAFPPEKILVDSRLFHKWRWDHCLLHPRLTPETYHTIRRLFTIHNHFSFLCQNHFLHSRSILPYFRVVRDRFLLRVVRARRISHKLRLLTILSHHIHPLLFRHISRFI